MKALIKKILPIVDIILTPFIYPAAWLLKSIRKIGVHRLPLCKRVLIKIGVFPIRSHYYEPQFDNRSLALDFSKDRSLPGIDLNISEQLELLKRFVFYKDLVDIPLNKPESTVFYLNNSFFEAGDAEYWYQIIRTIKPKIIIEVGGGNSTLMAIKAINKNHKDDADYKCEHICIEPYEMPWLENSGVSLIRKKVEDMDATFFSRLGENDILFIDSSHIIKPHGDVLFEYLEILPSLNKGVIVHIHDIFSPKNYPDHWLKDEVRFWNEQYLLEAFLTDNSSWKVIGSLNYLRHHHYEKFKAIAPFLSPECEPASFYIQKIA